MKHARLWLTVMLLLCVGAAWWWAGRAGKPAEAVRGRSVEGGAPTVAEAPVGRGPSAAEASGAGEAMDRGLVYRQWQDFPGAEWVAARTEINDEPAGAPGLSAAVGGGDLALAERARKLARLALNAREEADVRDEALDQWLRLVPEEAEGLLLALARDGRLEPSACLVLLKDSFTRGRIVQSDLALELVAHPSKEVAALAREHLAGLVGADHGDKRDAWLAATLAFKAGEASR